MGRVRENVSQEKAGSKLDQSVEGFECQEVWMGNGSC